jgi:hypothetical protein
VSRIVTPAARKNRHVNAGFGTAGVRVFIAVNGKPETMHQPLDQIFFACDFVVIYGRTSPSKGGE